MNSSLEAIKEIMERGYPDCSDLNFILSAERGKGFAKDFAHRTVGGILPSFTSYEEYKAEALSKKLGLRRVDRAEEMVYLTLFILEKTALPREDAGFTAFTMLPAIRYARMFSLDRERLKDLKGITEEQERKIDELFDTMTEFDRYLEGLGLFMPVLREQQFREHSPGEKDFFVNLPLFTPVTQHFYRQVPSGRKLVDMPVFADSFKNLRPDYPSSLNLVNQVRVLPGGERNPSLGFHELEGKASIPAHLGSSIADFLNEREGNDQIFILLLDEALSFYLWQTVFKPLGDRINFSLGIPLNVTSAGARVRQFIEGIDRKGTTEDFSRFTMSLAGELYSHRNEYVREERWAFEAAIEFVDSFEKFAEPLGGAFSQVAGLALRQKQFFMKGDRSAPVQIVGLGETTGAPFDRGIIVPVNADVFPSRVYNGPFLNFIHTPQIRNAHFEMEDLALRQFMSFGEHIDIVSVFDETKNMAPSFFFTFLKNEFAGSVTRRSVPIPSWRSKESAPFVENDAAVREKILGHSFSFTSLSRILTCPFSFYFSHIDKLPIPDVMQEEEKTNQVLGSFVHEFFRRLAEEANPLDTWKPVFNDLWAGSQDVARLEGGAIFRLLLLDQIEALAGHEIEQEKLLLFDNTGRATERSLEAAFGESGQFKLNGRIDASIQREQMHIILDYKYKTWKPFKRGPIVFSIADSKDVDPKLQIVLYSYLLARAGEIRFEDIDGYFVYIREADREKRFHRLERAEIDSVEITMQALCDRLEDILSLERLEPNYKCDGCKFCQLKPLCKRENFFRKSAR